VVPRIGLSLSYLRFKRVIIIKTHMLLTNSVERASCV
jgi:hypothetical protein